ncbi:MAG: undecaprenyl-diphosphate phosphatase [bacterium]|nr:undecaprenyl-diphosphate phosphatase [bacterium]
MNILSAIILGLVEGLTEFLPISSTAHLIITSKLMQIPQSDFQKFFEVFIQSGAILAVLFLFGKYILKHLYLIKQIIFSFIPTAIIGFLLYKVIKTIFFESNNLIIGTIFFIGLIFILVEYLIKKKKIHINKSISLIRWKDAIIIGLAQSLATIPGVSRSGIVMVTMMIMGYKREESAIYSFLLAVPTILAASAYDVFKMKDVLMFSQSQYMYLIVGFIVSFVFASLSVKWLILFLQKKTLIPFGIYRVGLAISLLFIM